MSLRWDEPVVFEAWGSLEHGASMVASPESCAAMADPGDIALFSIRGTSWTEVMTAYHEIQGWEPYKPPPEE